MSKHRNSGTGSEARPEWLDIQGLTRYAEVSERTVRDWIHSASNPLPASQVGGKILVRRSDIDTWLLQHRIKPAGSVAEVVNEMFAEVTGGSRYKGADAQ